MKQYFIAFDAQRSQSKRRDSPMFQPVLLSPQVQNFIDRLLTFLLDSSGRVLRLLATQSRKSCAPTVLVGRVIVKQPFSPFDSKTTDPRNAKSREMNTCKSVSKQATLTPLRMNTCKKQGEGVSLVKGYGPGTQSEVMRRSQHNSIPTMPGLCPSEPVGAVA